MGRSRDRVRNASPDAEDEEVVEPSDEALQVHETPADAEPESESDDHEQEPVEQGPAEEAEIEVDESDGDEFEVDPDDDPDDLVQILEAMLFAAHEPMTAVRLSLALPGVPKARVVSALGTLQDDLFGRSPLQLVELAGGWRLVTRPEFAPYLARLYHKGERERLSAAALETLAIVAYRQPVTRGDIEGIRGVQAGPVLRALQERKLIKVVGRAPIVGRPQQYGTTKRFLDHFGLNELTQLPSLFGDEFRLKTSPSAPLVGPDLDAVDPDALVDPLEAAEEGEEVESGDGGNQTGGALREEGDALATEPVEADEDGDLEEPEVLSSEDDSDRDPEGAWGEHDATDPETMDHPEEEGEDDDEVRPGAP